jgi:phosphoribosylglycinamide formyltransferase-1
VIDPRAWPAPPIFRIIQEAGRVEDAEMRRTFNMGLGYLLVVRPGDAARAAQALSAAGERVFEVGEIRAGARSVVSMPEPLRVGVLASGRGSNLEALLEAVETGRVPAVIGALVTDRATAGALEIARGRGVEALFVDPRQYPSREAHEKAVIAALDERGVGLVCLAGYMRVLGATFVRHFEGRLLNVHPAAARLPGLHAQRQALEHGVKVAGATVHFVDEGTDTGPIVLQAAVPVLPGDTEETLSRRILAEEHRIYPEAVRLFAERRLTIDGRRVHIRESP